MARLTHDELIILLMSISIMLILSRIVAELGKKIKMPLVMGEIMVGIILGPTIFGIMYPDMSNILFPQIGSKAIGAAIALDGIVNLSVIMLLFVVGLEVQLPLVLKQGRLVIYTSISSMIIPFFTGFATAWYFPQLFGVSNSETKPLFALFFGTALSISALPVIARILMDMNLFKTNIGMLIIASATFVDLIGWLIFSFILSLTGNDNGVSNRLFHYIYNRVWLIYAYYWEKNNRQVFAMDAKKLSWPGGVLSISLGVCLLCAAFTASIKIHPTLGAFIAGIAIGDSVHLHEKEREIIHQFVTNFFAPLFFVSIGLRVHFIENFDLSIVLIVLILAYVGKVLGASIGAYFGGMTRKHSLAVGFGMNARGAMEIILGTLALNAGLISAPVFVALVIMALVTSLTSGPLMKRFI